MSQTDEISSETVTTKPVGTQVVSEEAPRKRRTRPVDEDESVRVVQPDPEQVKLAVQQELSNKFAVSDSWTVKPALRFVIECPSGQSLLVKHLNTMDLVNADLVEDLDFFAKKLFATQQVSDEEVQEHSAGLFATLRDIEKRKRFLDMTGRLLAAASVKPKVIHDGVAIIEDSETGEKEIVFGHQIASVQKQIEIFGKVIPTLKEGQCYSGPIDFGDRMYVFSEMNRPLELIEPFRDESDAVLASVQSKQKPELPSE